MSDKFSRTILMIGEQSFDKLQKSRIAVFGAGGVGGFVIEALARSGIGAIDVIDNDRVSESNINRQIIATTNTIGEYKTDVIEKRVHEINPDIKVTKYPIFYTPENADEFDFAQYDYIVDAIDTVAGKLEIAFRAEKSSIPVISCMGAGNKMNPLMFEVSDIYKTSVCPLARVMRQELKKRGVKKLKVVYSKETPAVSADGTRHRVPASIAFVPSVAGLVIAGEVIKDLIGYSL